jgi:serine/threonine-protein kinase RsbW
MSEAYASVLTRKANEMGYMFSGIIPELCDGDVLKMQYLNNVIVIPENINLAGELSKEILEVIIQDYHD